MMQHRPVVLAHSRDLMQSHVRCSQQARQRHGRDGAAAGLTELTVSKTVNFRELPSGRQELGAGLTGQEQFEVFPSPSPLSSPSPFRSVLFPLVKKIHETDLIPETWLPLLT